MPSPRRFWLGFLLGAILPTVAVVYLLAAPVDPPPEAAPTFPVPVLLPEPPPPPPTKPAAPPPAPPTVPAPSWPRDAGGEMVQRLIRAGELPPPASPSASTGPTPRVSPLDRGEWPLPPPEFAPPPAPPLPPVSARVPPPPEPLPAEFGPPALDRAKELRPTPREKK